MEQCQLYAHGLTSCGACWLRCNLQALVVDCWPGAPRVHLAFKPSTSIQTLAAKLSPSALNGMHREYLINALVAGQNLNIKLMHPIVCSCTCSNLHNLLVILSSKDLMIRDLFHTPYHQ